ncbi:hypothetical protein ACFPP6_09790 [Streptomyces aureoversilis]|uniref:Integral membrane protein n=1 Tax=Streptomyces aureoversilis TaxID=67277 RepID=A0ABV9ZXR0_9ACTN
MAKALVGQASFIAALMFYLGAVYTSSYYGYFHLSAFRLGIGFPAFVIQSLNLLTLPVVVTGSVVLIVAGLRVPPSPFARFLSAALTTAARFHLVVLAAGLVLHLLWRHVQPYGWAAPVTLAAGLLLGLRNSENDEQPRKVRHRAVPLIAAGLLLLWAVTLGAAYQGRHQARVHARHVGQWTGVLALSSKRLSLHGVREEDLGAGLRHRYRYTGLRRLVEGSDGYYRRASGMEGGQRPGLRDPQE